MEPAAPARNSDPGSWWYLLHTKLYRYRALLRKYWWLVLFTTCAGLAVGAWKVASQETVFVSSGRMMVSGKLALTDGVSFIEENNYFMTTQRELMQDEAIRQRAEARVRATSPETPIGPVELLVGPLAQTSIFLFTATGSEPVYPQKFLDAVMQEYIATRRELRSQKTDSAESSIGNEIERAQIELHKEEDKLLDFQRKNNIGFLETEGNSAGAYLSKLNTQLSELKKEQQLLDLFQLDQKIAHDKKMREERATDDKDNAREGDLRSSTNRGSGAEYVNAQQQIEVLKSEREERSKDLKPKHPIIVEIDEKITRQQQLVETLRKQSTEELKRRREAAKLEIQNLEKTIKEQQTSALELAERLAEYKTIQAGVNRKSVQLESLSRSKGNVEITRNVDQEVVSIRQKASPAQPQKPGLARTVGTAVVLGLLAGLLFLVLIDQLDDRIASYTEFQALFPDHVLAQIPSAHVKKAAGDIPHLAPEDERHAYAESFRSLRSSLVFLPTSGIAPKVLLVTSAVPNEGKSTITVNLAITLALSGANVLLVDGDLRRGEIHRTLGLKNDRGFTDVLIGDCSIQAAAQPSRIPCLSLLSRGSSVTNPGELYLSKDADRFLKAAYARYDYVVIDSSPVMAADDTTSLAPKADATIFVFRFTSSSSRTSRKALDLLRERQANIIGIVCNDVSEAMQEYYYYRYPEYYGTEPKQIEGKVKTIQ